VGLPHGYIRPIYLDHARLWTVDRRCVGLNACCENGGQGAVMTTLDEVAKQMEPRPESAALAAARESGSAGSEACR